MFRCNVGDKGMHEVDPKTTWMTRSMECNCWDRKNCMKSRYVVRFVYQKFSFEYIKLEQFLYIQISGYQFSSVTQSCPALSNPMDCSTPRFPVYHQLLELHKLMSIRLMMPSNHLTLCRLLLLLPSIFPSIRVFSKESVLHIGWPNIGASASMFPMNIQNWFPLGCTGLISLQSKGLSRVFSNIILQKHCLQMTWSST